jgi:transcriptional regulator with XRE-family HTH domain
MPRVGRFSKESFGPTVRRLMAISRTTFRDLAATTGLSAGYLNHLVHGQRPTPADEILERIAAALGVQPEHFREYRLRKLVEGLETNPDVADRLYTKLTS